ncbi:type III-A CRISPR-associated protein Csm2 [Mastigocoleus testarum]|uniref:type III-A CRISPR-associated protein Csm2 n=1 Tax=Mastigocoleus testarum TaxID=996925 RepID=UPI00040B983D|nr:type III-A CRISPR-associated protein Csm2 [Mastigocoleus testarum]
MSKPIKPNPPSVSRESAKKINQSVNTSQRKSDSQHNSQQDENIVKLIKSKIESLKEGLKTYPIRELVEHAEKFGPYLKLQRLETNQIRKFLDAINRLKAELAETGDFSKIETEVVLLKPKLAYAAARQRAAKPLNDVMSVAIDVVRDKEDFERLVQLIESIIAYHKAEGGK